MTDEYIRTDELDDALVPLAALTVIFNVSRRTIQAWMEADSIQRVTILGSTRAGTRKQKGIRWGDIPKQADNGRWVRR